jgi:hypothetical protein
MPKEARKRSYTVKEGQTIRVGVRISEKEQNELGLPTAKKSQTYTGGDKVELTDEQALANRHALEDAPELTDIEVDRLAEQARQMGDTNPDRKAIEEAIKTRTAPAGPDFGRLPRSHEVDLMMRANKKQEQANRQNPERKGREGFREVDSSMAAAGTGANKGRNPNPDAQADAEKPQQN